MRCTQRKYYGHFVQRINDRYGIVVTDRIYNDMIRQIQNHKLPTKVMASTASRSIHRVWVNSIAIYVVYRKRLGKASALVTALPPSKYLKRAFLQERQKQGSKR